VYVRKYISKYCLGLLGGKQALELSESEQRFRDVSEAVGEYLGKR